MGIGDIEDEMYRYAFYRMLKWYNLNINHVTLQYYTMLFPISSNLTSKP